jgi:osmotically-inducible protein OsmY
MRFMTMFGVAAMVALFGCAEVQKDVKAVESKVGGAKGMEDDALLAAVKVELGKDAKTKPHNFNATVKGGVVTLTGSGPADAKAQAEKVAKVPGVTSITNQIVVK